MVITYTLKEIPIILIFTEKVSSLPIPKKRKKSIWNIYIERETNYDKWYKTVEKEVSYLPIIIFEMGKKEPDLFHELKILIEDQLPTGSSGFKARGKKYLKYT